MEFEPKQDHEGRWYTYDPETELYWAYFADEYAYKSLMEDHNKLGEKPELYYDNEDGYYHWKGQVLNYDEETELYYIIIDDETLNLPAKEADDLENDRVPTWCDSAPSTADQTPERTKMEDCDIEPAINDEAVETEAVETEAVEGEGVEGEGVEEAVEGEGVEGDAECVETEAVETEAVETEAVEAVEAEGGEGEAEAVEAEAVEADPVEDDAEPEPEVKLMKPPAQALPKIAGALFQTKELDTDIFHEGCESLLDQIQSPEYLEYFRVNKWGDFAVGRCRRSFTQLISEDVTIEDIAHRVNDLISLLRYINYQQLLAIRIKNKGTQWTASSQAPLRAFAESCDAQLPLQLTVQFLMAGVNHEEANNPDNYFVARYGPRDEKKDMILEVQQIIKELPEQYLINIGRTIIFIEGILTKHPIPDSIWELPRPLNATKEFQTLYYITNKKEIINTKPDSSIVKMTAAKYGGGSNHLFIWTVLPAK